MCSLSLFPPPPPKAEITVGEFDSHLLTAVSGAELSRYSEVLSYPKINIGKDILRPSSSRESAKSAFIQHEDTFWKKAAMAWHEQGIMGVLEELARSNGKSFCYHWGGIFARSIISALKWVNSLHGSIFPHLMLNNEDMSADFSLASDWKQGAIRAFAWHPQTLKCAIALRDDSVRIFASKSDLLPILKHKFQKGIADIAWKPYCASLLAVACHKGILLWQIDPTSLITRPSSSCVTLLAHNGHAPLTSIAWHPDGSLLVSASVADTAMNVWNIAKETCIPLRRFGGGGVSLLKWSPDGERLFAATPSSLFRVWETQTWTCERWSKLIGRCQAACWSPDGTTLLFATRDEPVIYFLNFCPSSDIKPHAIGGSKSAIPLIDVSEITVASDDGRLRIGGSIQDMAWDKTGERLAVSFRGNNEVIAVFRTKVKPAFEISPCGFVKGQFGEFPQLFSFHACFRDGALLTVCWSSGNVTHIPFLFVPLSLSSSDGIMLSQKTSVISRDISALQRRYNLFSSPQ